MATGPHRGTHSGSGFRLPPPPPLGQSPDSSSHPSNGELATAKAPQWQQQRRCPHSHWQPKQRYEQPSRPMVLAVVRSSTPCCRFGHVQRQT